MKKLSLQWRITLMTALLIGVTCVAMNCLISSSGRRYMDSIGETLQEYSIEGEPAFFDPGTAGENDDITIIISGAQQSFITTNWCITAAVTLLSGVLAYFVTGRALKPLHTFAARAEQVQPNNLAEMKLDEEVLPEFQQFSRSFNRMLDRLNEGFTAQRQFTGNAAHELRTPLSLMQAQLELFSAEHPNVLPETADFLRLLREQTERMTQMTKTLLEMSELRTVPCTDRIELAPMVEEIFEDIMPLAEKKGITLECEGDGVHHRHRGGQRAGHPGDRYRVRHPGAVPGKHLPALFPGGAVPQPGIRRRGAGSCAGVGDCGTARRQGGGGAERRNRHHHGGAAPGRKGIRPLTRLNQKARGVPGGIKITSPPYDCNHTEGCSL